MNTHKQFIRPACAWALILLLLMQWVGGRIYINVVYAVEVNSEMDEKEQAISEKMKTETGIAARVEIRDEAQLEALHKLGYGAPYIFTAEENGETSYFTVDQSSVQLIQHQYQVRDQQDQDERSAQKDRLDRLFSDFCFDEPNCLFHKDLIFHKKVFRVAHLNDISNISNPSPPPRQGMSLS